MRIRIKSNMAETLIGFADKNIDGFTSDAYESTTWDGEMDFDAEMTTDSDNVEARLEHVFRRFNRVEPGDEEYLRSVGYNLPSLSVGDVVVFDPETPHARAWKVMGAGWEVTTP
jgi:hypothetical protein